MGFVHRCAPLCTVVHRCAPLSGIPNFKGVSPNFKGVSPNFKGVRPNLGGPFLYFSTSVLGSSRYVSGCGGCSFGDHFWLLFELSFGQLKVCTRVWGMLIPGSFWLLVELGFPRFSIQVAVFGCKIEVSPRRTRNARRSAVHTLRNWITVCWHARSGGLKDCTCQPQFASKTGSRKSTLRYHCESQQRNPDRVGRI